MRPLGELGNEFSENGEHRVLMSEKAGAACGSRIEVTVMGLAKTCAV